MKNIATDEGWFWVVPIGGFIANFIAGGIAKSFGLIIMSTKEFFNTSASPLTLASGLIYTFMYCLSIVGILFTEKFGSRTAVNIGSLGCVLSFLGAFLSNTVTMWVISIGCGIGISLAFIYSPVFITLGRCFHNRIGLAIGIAVAGSSVGQMVFPSIMSYVIDVYGVRSVFLFCAIISCHFFVTAALMPRYTVIHQLEKQVKQKENDIKKDFDQGNSSRKLDIQKPISSNHQLDSHFTTIGLALLIVFIVAKVFGDIGDVGIGNAMPLFAETEINLSKQDISVAIGVSGVVDLIARLGVGIISDQKWCRRSLLLSMAWLTGAINTALVLWFPYKIPYIIFYGIFGLTSGISVTLMTVVLIDFVGRENLKKGIGMMTFVLGLVISPGQFLLGYIKDVTGTYTGSMLFLGFNLIMAFLILTMEYPIRWICAKTSLTGPIDQLDYSLNYHYNPREALQGARATILRPLHKSAQSRREAFITLASIDAREFFSWSSERVS